MSALLMPNEILSMSAQAARRVVELGDGDCALLYLALLEGGGDVAGAQSRLNWSRDRLEGAFDRLAARELVDSGKLPTGEPPSLRQDDRLPEYTRGDVLNALEHEPEFLSLYREVERKLNRTLSDNDLKTLYMIYDHLSMPPEVISLLTHHVIQTLRRRNGDGSGSYPRMAQIRKEAFVWKRKGVDTVGKAEEFFRRSLLVDSREWSILSAVGVTEPRAAVDKEREYIEKWVDMGVSDKLIRLAYERTVFRKGCMNWPYVNRILQSWHQAGYTTPAQVTAGERPAGRRPGPAGSNGGKNDCQPTAERIRTTGEWLDRFLEEQEKGGN